MLRDSGHENDARTAQPHRLCSSGVEHGCTSVLGSFVTRSVPVLHGGVRTRTRRKTTQGVRQSDMYDVSKEQIERRVRSETRRLDTPCICTRGLDG